MDFQVFQRVQIVSSENNSYYTHVYAHTLQFEFKTNSTVEQQMYGNNQQVEFAGT